MQDITAGEIVARGNLRRARGFLMPLFAHYLIAFQAELHSRKGVDHIVNAGMARYKTA